jgi:hypothetical protein
VEGDFFAEFADLPGTEYEDEHFDLQEHELLEKTDDQEEIRVVITRHSKWFEEHGINPEKVL